MEWFHSMFRFNLLMEEASMKRSLFSIVIALVLMGVILAACAPGAKPTKALIGPAVTEAPGDTTAPAAAEKTALVGFTASLTGSLNVESTRQNNGFKLWMDQVNAAGGIKLKDGTVVKFDSKFYDDESKKDRVQELYTKLVT